MKTLLAILILLAAPATPARCESTTAAAQALTFTVFRGTDAQFYWHLQAANHRIIAQSEGYHNKADCLHAIDLIQRGAAQAVVKDGGTVKHSDGEVLVGTPYGTKRRRFTFPGHRYESRVWLPLRCRR